MEHGTRTFDEQMTTSEVARAADPPVTTDAVRTWERTGKLPARRLQSGMRLFERGDVETFLAARRAALAALKAKHGRR